MGFQVFKTASNFPKFDGSNTFTQIQQVPGPDFRKLKLGKSLYFCGGFCDPLIGMLPMSTHNIEELEKKNYGKCSKISNTVLFPISNELMVLRSGIYKMLVRMANREDPDQTASSEADWSGSALFV